MTLITNQQTDKLADIVHEKSAVPFTQHSYFMGAGTPVNVFELETNEHRPATRRDVRQLAMLQDALPQIDIVRPTATATDIE